MVGTTMALIALGIAGAEAAKAGIDAHAATSAAKTQTDYSNRALDMQRDLWGQNQRVTAPYLAAGNAGNAQMSQFMQAPPLSNPNPFSFGVPVPGVGSQSPVRQPTPPPPANPLMRGPGVGPSISNQPQLLPPYDPRNPPNIWATGGR